MLVGSKLSGLVVLGAMLVAGASASAAPVATETSMPVKTQQATTPIPSPTMCFQCTSSFGTSTSYGGTAQAGGQIYGNGANVMTTVTCQDSVNVTLSGSKSGGCWAPNAPVTYTCSGTATCTATYQITATTGYSFQTFIGGINTTASANYGVTWNDSENLTGAPITLTASQCSDKVSLTSRCADELKGQLNVAAMAQTALNFLKSKLKVVITKLSGGPGGPGYYGYTPCLASNDAVTMIDGSTKRVKDLAAGDWVRSVDAAGAVSRSRVADVQTTKAKDLRTLRFAGGTLAATSEHLIYAAHGAVKTLGEAKLTRVLDVKAGDTVFALRGDHVEAARVLGVKSVAGAKTVHSVRLVDGPSVLFANGIAAHGGAGEASAVATQR